MKPNTFRSHPSRQLFSSSEVTLPWGIAPALFTRMSTSPHAAASVLTFALTERSMAWQVTSTLCTSVILRFAVSRLSALREAICRWQPSAASTRAAPKPIPRDPPVTCAVRPWSPSCMEIPSSLECEILPFRLRCQPREGPRQLPGAALRYWPCHQRHHQTRTRDYEQASDHRG